MYDLQSRWKKQGRSLVYHGLRCPPHLFQNRISLSAKQEKIVARLPCRLTKQELAILGRLVGVQIVPMEEKRAIPTSLETAHFCKSCVANDFMIPGLEFDRNGLCPICQTTDETASYKSILPIMNEFPRAKRSRFDVALFYTGGKDSTYLLYYLSKVLGLRVLALTWEIPFLSETAVKSISRAKQAFPSVEFISRHIADNDLRRIYCRLYELSGNVCACPSLAYVLFYPELVANRVPYFVAGNEPAQMLGLYYNHMTPPLAYRFSEKRTLSFLFNIGRLLTLRPPLKKGQYHTLKVMHKLAGKDSLIQRKAGYANELVDNIVTAINTVPDLIKPFKRALHRSDRTGNIPAFVQVDLDAVSGGIYRWSEVKELIQKECGWQAPCEEEKGLHTSCTLEKCKEHTQFKRFYRMESTMIPFSALELAIASSRGVLSREEALKELKNSLGFSLSEVAECSVMKEYLKL